VHNVRLLRKYAFSPLFLLLSGCNTVVLNPTGDIAARQRDLLIHSTVLMLIIIIPVIALTVLFAWRYRQTNKEARYEPDWHHSTRLELVIWAAPLLIIICLGALTWLGTHLLDPYRPLDRLGRGQAIAQGVRPLEVEVIALDWKWLFIYPEYGIATVNDMAVPVNRPISMRITASSVMNSLYIPELAGMIYAMPGMETKLHGVANEAKESQGFSSNYSGAGFSGMRFAFHAVDDAKFDQWVQKVRESKEHLMRDEYRVLVKPSQSEPARHFGHVDEKLYHDILNRCVEAGQTCMDQMMAGAHHSGGTATEHDAHEHH
jgi:cytochrome o ubiquinol oxidase subunit II